MGLFTQLFFSISFLRRLLDTVLKVTSRPIFVSRCITVTCLLFFLWTCTRHEILNIDNNFFYSMVNRIYPSELQLNKANVSDAEASFLDLHLSISDGFVKTKIYDKRDDFDFDIVNFPFLDDDVPRSASYGVYISQLIRFARVSSHVDDFNTRNKVLTAKLLRQGYRYHKLRKAFSKFYRRHFDIVSKYNVGLKTLLLQGLSEPEFYGDLVYKFRKIIVKNDFPYHFKR